MTSTPEDDRSEAQREYDESPELQELLARAMASPRVVYKRRTRLTEPEIDAVEEAEDEAAYDAAKAEGGPRIPWSEVKAGLGLTDADVDWDQARADLGLDKEQGPSV